MATYKITAVRTEKTESDPHEHITRVRVNGATTGEGYSRATVIADLKNPDGDRYYTEAGDERADVIVVECPHCTFSDYITTEPDSTKANNLLDLERF